MRPALLSLLLWVSFAGAAAANPETYVYKKIGKHAIHADVYRPEGKGPWPVLLWIHGGSFVTGSREWLPGWQRSLYLGKGFVVVSIDYRLYPGTKLDEIYRDLADAYSWIRARGPSLFSADKKRIVVAGHSAGGFLALATGYLLSPRPKAIGVISGFASLTSPFFLQPSERLKKEFPVISKERVEALMATKPVSNDPTPPPGGRYEIYVRGRQQNTWLKELTGKDPAKDKAWFDKHEPARNINRAFPPVFQVHSESDEVVPMSEVAIFRDAMKKAGASHELTVLSGDSHAFGPEHKSDPGVQEAFTRMAEFLHTAVKP